MVPPRGIRGNRPRLRGEAVLKPGGGKPPAAPACKKILFVCIGNSCRSQMAEAFARAYGSDVLVAHSAGLSPATLIAPLTRQVLEERRVGMEGQFPKDLALVSRERFDVVINMSGHPLAIPQTRVIEWPVRDPIGGPEAVYRAVAAQIEGLVMRLILDLRSGDLRSGDLRSGRSGSSPPLASL
jgi:arsenate reductase (thioredoxin)